MRCCFVRRERGDPSSGLRRSGPKLTPSIVGRRKDTASPETRTRSLQRDAQSFRRGARRYRETTELKRVRRCVDRRRSNEEEARHCADKYARRRGGVAGRQSSGRGATERQSSEARRCDDKRARRRGRGAARQQSSRGEVSRDDRARKARCYAIAELKRRKQPVRGQESASYVACK